MEEKQEETSCCGRDENGEKLCMSRRSFLFTGGTTVVMAGMLPGSSKPTAINKREYPRKKIASLSNIKQDEPFNFKYPFDDDLSSCFVVKLGQSAGGGIGDDKDIVAFNYFCPHMGGPLMGTYKKKYKAMGPCPFHLTTFDLTRFGIVISGQATESLPQIYLELDGEDIYATGVMGIIYGKDDTLG